MDLTGEGNVFGLDESQQPTLQDMHDRLDDPTIYNGVRDKGGMVVLATYRCPKPVIGAINGAAVGIGATMTLPFDVRIACDKTRIGFVFGKLGIVPEATSGWFLPRIVGLSQALEWVYTAEILTPHAALAAGLVRSVVPADDLLDTAYDLAHRFTQNRSPVATALARQMMYRNCGLAEPLEAHRIDSLAMFYTSKGEGKEGVQAFLDKRDPNFAARVSRDMPPFYPWW